jgi:CPA1 family monovalent cation:H+ antiporter
MLQRAEASPDGDAPAERPTDPLRRRAIAAARRVANNLRDQGVIGDKAFHRLEEELDLAELSASSPNPE